LVRTRPPKGRVGKDYNLGYKGRLNVELVRAENIVLGENGCAKSRPGKTRLQEQLTNRADAPPIAK
jgi:hypothetical protein